MLQTNIATCLKNIFRTPFYSLVTISGLSLAMSGAILLMLWIFDAISVDKFHNKNIYKLYNATVTNGYKDVNDFTPVNLGPLLATNISDINLMSRTSNNASSLKYNQKILQSTGLNVDSSFLDIFNFPLVSGNSRYVLTDKNAIVITETLSKKLIGGTDNVGKTIIVEGIPYTIQGILKDLPANTQFNFEYLLPLNIVAESKTDFSRNDIETYLLLNPESNRGIAQQKITDFVLRNGDNNKKAYPFLHPFSRVWLHGQFINGKESGGLIDIVYLLSGVSFMLLLIGSINFINLSTARSEKRAKEVGVRKVMGARRYSLIIKFLGESIILVAIAGFFSLIIAQLTLPYFNLMMEKQLKIDYGSVYFYLVGVLFIVIVGVIAGIYPAFFLSSFKPITAIKSNLGKVRGALITPRKVLVVVQFIISAVMLNYSFAIIKQTSFMKKKNLGYDIKRLAYYEMTPELKSNYEVVKQELLSSGLVNAVNKTSGLISGYGSTAKELTFNGEKVNADVEMLTANTDFVKLNGLTLIEGRDIDLGKFSLDTLSCVINETAAKVLNTKDDIIGLTIKEDKKQLKIVGVIKDYVNAFPGHSNRPLLLIGNPQGNYLNIAMRSEKVSSADIEKINMIVKKHNSSYLTEFKKIETDYNQRFRGANTSINLSIIFTCAIIFISCLGLLGLCTFLVESRKREIAIRKVIGAGVFVILKMLLWDFLKLIVLAIVIGTPISLFVMNSAIQNFSYRINITWYMPLIIGLVIIALSTLTIVMQSLKAASANPVKPLRI